MKQATTTQVHAISTPEPAFRWARHAGDARWHAIASVEPRGSAITYCHGRWPARDAVEHSGSPPHEDRCGRCQREAIEARRIEIGLAEVAAVAPIRVVEWGFDTGDVEIGGES